MREIGQKINSNMYDFKESCILGRVSSQRKEKLCVTRRGKKAKVAKVFEGSYK